MRLSKARPISGAMGILHFVLCNGIYLLLNHMAIVGGHIFSLFTVNKRLN